MAVNHSPPSFIARGLMDVDGQQLLMLKIRFSPVLHTCGHDGYVQALMFLGRSGLLCGIRA